ncbi:PDZ domain-containing protein [Ruficoccus amylovorans]|uniref:PDZ domain-containing protein n=1 Tax=Ruficoccus amylovorans TaxID=1804625 RepID=A0A842HBW0_9BACT|nr:PDZ domain-containing protein [Ruficoccus amylovorans]MBC2593558.1 PDZ domain-containing protein [Ruficoccus amylovorans]
MSLSQRFSIISVLSLLLLAAGLRAQEAAPAVAPASDGVSAAMPENFETLFNERTKSVVAVEMFVQNEIDREPLGAVGVVFDAEGRIILLDNAMPSWLPPERFKDIRVRPLGEDVEGYPARYLGQDFLTGHHFLQLTDGLGEFVPVTQWGKSDIKTGQFLWGIGVMNKPWHFLPYFLCSRLSAVEKLPWEIGFTVRASTSPGSVLFDAQGRFAGWGSRPSTEEKLLILDTGQQRPVGLQDLRETNAFLTVERFYDFIQRVPATPEGDARPWLGATGMQPLSREVAQFLGLEGQGAVVVSDIIEDSPAAKGDLSGKDIIIKIDGQPLPKLRPDVITPRYVETELMSRQIGDKVTLTVIRGDEEKDLEFELGQQPKVLKEAEREYYPGLGLGIREFLLMDGIARRQLRSDVGGVVADFIKPNSKVSSGGLQVGDWIKEIDGTEINTFAQAREILAAIESDTDKSEAVMLVERNNETKVLRIKLK